MTTSCNLRFDLLDEGDASWPVVLMLHGFPSGKECWNELASTLVESGYRVIRFDQRGYSPTARPRGRFSYRVSSLMADVECVLSDLSVTRCHVIGHDWGGLLTWHLAMARPKLVASATVMAASHPAAFVQSLTLSQMRSSWYMMAVQFPILPELILRRQNGAILRRLLLSSGLSDAWCLKYTSTMVTDTARIRSAINWYRAMPLDIRAHAKLGISDVPVLYMSGGMDRFGSEESAAATKRMLNPISKSIRYPEMDHWMPEDHSDRIAPTIRDFIDRNR